IRKHISFPTRRSSDLEKAKDTTDALIALRKAYTIQPVNTYALELAHLYAESRNSAALEICDDVLSKDKTHELLDPLFIKGIYYRSEEHTSELQSPCNL